MVDTNRRQFLQAAGVTGGLGLAGCLDDEDDTTDEEAVTNLDDDVTDDADDTDDNDDTDDTDGVPDVAAILMTDQMAIQQREQELAVQVQEGELSQEEAQQELQELQEELTNEAIESFEAEVDDDVQIDEREPAQGAIRLSGDSDALLQTLSYDSVNGLVDAAVLDQQPAP